MSNLVNYVGKFTEEEKDRVFSIIKSHVPEYLLESDKYNTWTIHHVSLKGNESYYALRLTWDSTDVRSNTFDDFIRALQEYFYN